MTHKIKILDIYADAVLYGSKNFEVRYNDRGYQKGDTICFQVVHDVGRRRVPVEHKLNEEQFRITYVLTNADGIRSGYCVLGIEKSRRFIAKSDGSIVEVK